ncbi:MAG: hypothetical protein IPG50_11485 [Myxococcales bacterium]|nr:hypothetical protein [Myxococcales bacterium]
MTSEYSTPESLANVATAASAGTASRTTSGSRPCANTDSTANSGARFASASSVMYGIALGPSTNGANVKLGPNSTGLAHHFAIASVGATTSTQTGHLSRARNVDA